MLETPLDKTSVLVLIFYWRKEMKKVCPLVSKKLGLIEKPPESLHQDVSNLPKEPPRNGCEEFCRFLRTEGNLCSINKPRENFERLFKEMTQLLLETEIYIEVRLRTVLSKLMMQDIFKETGVTISWYSKKPEIEVKIQGDQPEEIVSKLRRSWELSGWRGEINIGHSEWYLSFKIRGTRLAEEISFKGIWSKFPSKGCRILQRVAPLLWKWSDKKK